MIEKNTRKIRFRKLFLAKAMTVAIYYRIVGNETKMTTTLAETFLSLGGVYVKFLQGVLMRVPIMKNWKSDHRFDVYENVPYEQLDIHAFLKANLNVWQNHQIIKVADIPFASGSFGQVYRGQLRSGEQVAIKILRPNTRKILRSDLRLIRVVSKFIAGLLTSWDIDLKVVVKDFVKSTFAETDYKSEVAFAERLYEYYKNNKTIVIPKTFSEISNKTVIVQEYISGFSLAQLLRDTNINVKDYAKSVFEATGSDLGIQLQQLGIELNKAILNSAPIHGDPHPGNIRLLSDNKVALLDFGIQTKPMKYPNSYYSVLKEFWRAEYLNEPRPGEMFVAYIKFYAGKLYESLKLVSDFESNRSNKSIKLDEWISQFSDKLFKDKVTPDMLTRGLDNIRNGEDSRDISVDRIVNPGNRFSIGVRIDNGLVLRAMANYLSLVTELGYRSVVAGVYNEVVEYVESNLPNLLLDPPPTINIMNAIEIVYLWLEKIANKDADLYQQIVSYMNLG